MAAWTVRRHETRCGSRGCAIPAGAPVYALLRGVQLRCAEHAGVPVDWTEVELERYRLEEDLRREAARRAAGDQPRAVIRFPARVRPPRPASAVQASLLTDPRRRAANDHD